MNDQCTCRYRPFNTDPCPYCTARIADAEDRGYVTREESNYYADQEQDRWERSTKL